MSKMMVIEVEGKEYCLGFPTRQDAKIAEAKGLDFVGNRDKILTLADKLFYVGLLAKQPTITENEANEIEEKYIEAKGDLEEIIKFLSDQFQGFIKSQDSKKSKKAKIIEM